jgi:hypothetical protein
MVIPQPIAVTDPVALDGVGLSGSAQPTYICARLQRRWSLPWARQRQRQQSGKTLRKIAAERKERTAQARKDFYTRLGMVLARRTARALIARTPPTADELVNTV